MVESLRIRLVLWYALILGLVVVLYGSAVSYQFWRSMVAEMDRELAGRVQQVTSALQPVPGGRFDVELTTEALEYFRLGGGSRYYVIWNDEGELVAGSNPDLDVSFPGRAGARMVDGRREVAAMAAAGATVVVGRVASDLRDAMWALAVNVSLAGAAMLAVAIFGGWFVARRALAPVERISRVARAMSEGDLDARIPIDQTETELGQVASALNDAFDRLRLAIQHERRFIADASHELRTPLSILRAEVDAALGREQSVAESRESLGVCRRAVVRMQTIVERLLALARAEGGDERGRAGTSDLTGRAGLLGPPESQTSVIPLRDMVTEVAAWLEPLAHERAVAVTVLGDEVQVAGDETQLREAIGNVITNAIVYNRAGGQVRIALSAADDRATVEVADTGRGIPAAALPHVFDRFFRVDQARARSTGGAGLGLAVARAIVESHRGTIACSSREGAGSIFVVTLPLTTHGSELKTTPHAPGNAL
jgi:signal transduction histidine kinase